MLLQLLQAEREDGVPFSLLSHLNSAATGGGSGIRIPHRYSTMVWKAIPAWVGSLCQSFLGWWY